ncbi:hypothetical protein N7532_006897 [Penicillium argentinense]|uniref:Uncharacterized protein n=1 Tax=Penicillium argentinense TaxID=1131581 RepID=A0A9W9FGS8_9EURO|nr:uncharacterized protein N7532_006897 [Penicillium argentinense]KAJ5099896.1 hypothetical protein N7532_006897 [Penicillium argentinense]
MTTFSLVTLSILALLFVVRYRKEIVNWPITVLRGKGYGKDVAPDDPSNVKRLAPYPAQPIKGRERYRVMMDIRKLDSQNWLTLDKNYMEEHRVRDHLLREKREQVLRCLPESLEACREALEEVSDFLCQRFPNMFQKVSHNDQKFIQNCMTGERFDIGGSPAGERNTDALEAAVRLTMEDLSILMLNNEGEYYLAASASLFPTGWTVQERIGWTISQLHAPVPLWHQQVSNSVSKFLSRLTSNSPMERSNYFVEVKRPDEDLFEILYRPGALCEKELSNPSPEQIIIRRERQTFRRLPRTGALVFGVKTYLTTLDQLPMQELENLVKEMKSWPEHVAEYKGMNVWSAKVLEFYNMRMAASGLQDEVKEKVEV